MKKFMVLDNLVQPSASGIAGEFDPIVILIPDPQERSVPKPGESHLWRPNNLEEVGHRAQRSAEEFRKRLGLK